MTEQGTDDDDEYDLRQSDAGSVFSVRSLVFGFISLLESEST